MRDRKAYMRERWKRLHYERRIWLIEKWGGKCNSCGSTKQLEFDHIDPKTKSFNIGQHYGRYSKDRLLEEANKCQLLCNSCHWDKTGRANHGTPSKYTAGCRCDECRKSWASYLKERK
jgi:5-methylcytosine-specific restriction endonuclease McrA